MNTFKEVAVVLREAEAMRLRGEVQRINDMWHCTRMEPVGVCACGGIALVAGLEVNQVWGEYLFRSTYPVLARMVIHPVDGYEDDLVTVLSTMNNNGWTWTRMADWLEGLEEGE